MLSAMRYKNYVWPYNPRTFSVALQRQTVIQKIPGGLFAVQDLGRTCRVMTGEGEFCGLSAYDNFKKLATVFASEGPGPLVHPIWLSAEVYFTRLELTQEPRENYVAYAFEFTEADDGLRGMLTGQELILESETTHVVQEGETVWSICQELGIGTEQFLKNNPTLPEPNALRAGQVVKLR